MLQNTFPLASFSSSVCGRVSAWTKKLTRERQVVRNFGTAAAYSQGGVMAKVTVMKHKPTHLQIANRAFEIYVSRGGDHGHDVGDWFEAERQLQTSSKPRREGSRCLSAAAQLAIPASFRQRLARRPLRGVPRRAVPSGAGRARGLTFHSRLLGS